ncbi:MAG: type II toxin-antitoxin system RelE/ParE family toxin [Asticcacaulis sp.]|uniref:type II toxin-antitoxin system RelE/ParE family toxin n=1 Tax=Asticcacaulis sp. TaxID=1872648 RepID=UPI0025C1353A|nr:type II toxin-antitoxin system RelE/ParE family toxin [Asticcacaulis sp.]MCA1934631.1 type II toxin-antitoxin system RelE/ParE family toxin [Asticcacaulis sp.]
MKVVVSAAAESDLEAIADYIALDSRARAISFVNEIVEAALALADMPLAYPLVSGFEASGIRRKPFRRYLIFYRVEAARIVIIHVLNAAQDHPPLLGKEA